MLKHKHKNNLEVCRYFSVTSNKLIAWQHEVLSLSHTDSWGQTVLMCHQRHRHSPGPALLSTTLSSDMLTHSYPVSCAAMYYLICIFHMLICAQDAVEESTLYCFMIYLFFYWLCIGINVLFIAYYIYKTGDTSSLVGSCHSNHWSTSNWCISRHLRDCTNISGHSNNI